MLAIGRYAVLKKLAPKTRFRSAPDAADTKLVQAFVRDAASFAHTSRTKIPNSLSAGVLRRFFRNPFQNRVPATDTSRIIINCHASSQTSTPHRANPPKGAARKEAARKAVANAGAASWVGCGRRVSV